MAADDPVAAWGIAPALDESGLNYDDYTKASGDAAAVASDPKFKKYLAAAVKCVTGSTDFSIPDDISIPDTGN